MSNLIFYFLFVKTKKYFLIIYFLFFDAFIFYFLMFLFLIIYFNLIKKLNILIIKYLNKKNINIYLHSNYDYIKSLIVITLFFIYYIVYLRIIIFFCSRDLNINLFSIKEKLIFFSFKINNNLFISLGGVFSTILIFYMIIYLYIYYITLISKINFLKLHYYSFYRNSTYRKFIFSMIYLETFIRDITTEIIYKFFVYLRAYILHFIMFIFLLKSIFFDNGNLYNLLLIFPYFRLYIFLLNIYNYIIYNINSDFDILIMESYYKDIFFIMELDETKKMNYINFLVSNYSEYKFKDSIYLIYYNFIESDFLMIETYKYTINAYPRDFFSRIKLEKPKFLNK